MQTQFTTRDCTKIQKLIQKKYKKVARNPEGLFKYPTGPTGLKALQYDPELLAKLPESVSAAYCGVGNPFSLGPIKKGDAVIDVGCGAGVDTILAAMMSGPLGNIVGIDMLPEMLSRAKENQSLAGIENIRFEEASAESLPLPARQFDTVISNGALNLVPDKPKALSEIFRVLKSGGQFLLADNVLIGQLPENQKDIIKSWAQ